MLLYARCLRAHTLPAEAVVQASLKPQWRQARHDDAGRSAWQQQQRRASMSTPVVAGLTFVPESAYDFGVWDPNYRA